VFDLDARDVSNKAEICRKNGNYNGAIELYNEVWEKENQNFNEWDSWRYSFCLRKVGKVKEALEICTQAYEQYPDFSQIKSIYSWCIFDYYIRKNSEDIRNNESEFFVFARKITNITKQEKFSPYEITVIKVIDYLKEKPSFPYTTIDDFLSKLDPRVLSNESFSFTDSDGIKRETASNKEKWYSLKAKVLEKQGKYQECIDVCNCALSEVNKFHYDNDVWFKNRIAVSKGKLGLKEEAISELIKLLQYKEHWAIQYEISQLYNEMGKQDEALNFAYDAALNGNDRKIKLPLYFHLALILKNRNEEDMAKKHILFCEKIRNENNWSIPRELMEQIKFFDLNENNESAENIHKELKKYWTNKKIALITSITGEIQSILPNGKAGFISGNDSKKYYFKIKSFIGSRNDLKTGLKVSFAAKKGFDFKKGIESDEAVFIRKL